jgi:menaquinone-dependent protoporphyrinogen oxidase
MDTLIAVACHHVSAAKIADDLAQELRAAGHAIELWPIDRAMPIATPDAVIIGSEIVAGAWPPEARQFVERNWLRLAGVPTWLFSSDPLGQSTTRPVSELETLLAMTGAREHRLFVNRSGARRRSLIERLMGGAHAAAHRDTAVIRAWAGEIAAELALVSEAQCFA